MPQQKQKPSTAAERANEALDRAAPEGKSPARRTLDFLLKGSHDAPHTAPTVEPLLPTVPDVPTPRTVPDVPTVTQKPVAPERDFTRVANSIVRDAVAGGHFTGKSKQLYDYLYLRTRGAIKPVRTASLTKPEMMKGAGIGAEKTLLKNVAHLKSIGLIKVDYTDGSHKGNNYEVLLPEEIGLPALRTLPTLRTPPDVPTDQPPVPPVETTVRDVRQMPLESTTYAPSKTSFKTKEEGTDDDARARRFVARLIEVEKELTGKTSTNDEKWDDLAELLITELKIAAARTTVSNVPAFLTEHLRRRLWKVDKKQAAEIATAGAGRETAQLTLSDKERQACPDCAGTNFWYPEGPDKGVARCTHQKLQPVPKEPETP
jgi:hypothetical protein